MQLQVLKDSFGRSTGVFIPMEDWNIISEKYIDLKNLISIPKTKKKISDLLGSLSNETAQNMLQDVAKSRKSWENRFL